jgi:threonine dehydratase
VSTALNKLLERIFRRFIDTIIYSRWMIPPSEITDVNFISNLTQQDLYRASQFVAQFAFRTPIIDSTVLSKALGSQVVLKAESLQTTGSFKIRGAINKLMSLDPRERQRGVITVSSGNHGRAVAYMARELGIRAAVCLSEAVPSGKVQAIQELGAQVVLCGKTYDESVEEAYRFMVEGGLTMVHPFDDPLIIAGQGTIGLELLEDFPQVDTVVIPLSGGGLLSGIALALKTANPTIQVIGVSMERGPAMVRSLESGRVVEVVEEPTLADALAGGIGANNQYTFNIVQTLLDEAVLVSEDEIAQAMVFVLEHHHLVLEGGGAVGIAALLSGKVQHLGDQIAVILSGGNVDLPILQRIINEQSQT